MTVSFLTRAKGMEICFGDPSMDQPSIAASALRSIMSLSLNTRVLVAQNIIVAGGSCMVPGFKVRLIQEMKELIDNNPEFQELK